MTSRHFFRRDATLSIRNFVWHYIPLKLLCYGLSELETGYCAGLDRLSTCAQIFVKDLFSNYINLRKIQEQFGK